MEDELEYMRTHGHLVGYRPEMDPDEIAVRVVNAFTGDHYWIDTPSSIEAVAAALRVYGDERARAERERAIKAIQALGNLAVAIHHAEAQNILTDAPGAPD